METWAIGKTISMDGRPQISGILEITFLPQIVVNSSKSPVIAQWVSKSTGSRLRECLATWIHLLRESLRAGSGLQYMSNLVRRTDNPWWCVFLSFSLIVCCSPLYLWHYLKYLNCQKWLSHHFHKHLNYHNIVISSPSQFSTTQSSSARIEFDIGDSLIYVTRFYNLVRNVKCLSWRLNLQLASVEGDSVEGASVEGDPRQPCVV